MLLLFQWVDAEYLLVVGRLEEDGFVEFAAEDLDLAEVHGEGWAKDDHGVGVGDGGDPGAVFFGAGGGELVGGEGLGEGDGGVADGFVEGEEFFFGEELAGVVDGSGFLGVAGFEIGGEGGHFGAAGGWGRTGFGFDEVGRVASWRGWRWGRGG